MGLSAARPLDLALARPVRADVQEAPLAASPRVVLRVGPIVIVGVARGNVLALPEGLARLLDQGLQEEDSGALLVLRVVSGVELEQISTLESIPWRRLGRHRMPGPRSLFPRARAQGEPHGFLKLGSKLRQTSRQ